MILPITLTLAGAAAILHIWLAGRVSRLRAAHKVSIGDGGNELWCGGCAPTPIMARTCRSC